MTISQAWRPIGWPLGTGASRSVRVHGQGWTLFRDGEGTHALADRCPHRGYPLSRGRVEDGGLRCGYHGWLFDGRGECREVPGLPGGGEPCRPERRVTSRVVRESRGMLWMWPGDGDPSGAPPPCDVEAGPDAVTVRASMLIEAPLAEVAENILDVPHTAHLHRGLFRKARARNVLDVRVTRLSDRVEASYEGEPAPRGLLGLLLAPGGGVVSHVDRFLMPSVAQVDYGLGERSRILATTFLVPEDASRTRAFHVLSIAPRARAFVALPILAPVAGIVLMQDARALRVQAGHLASAPERRPISTEADVLGPHLRQMIERAARCEPPLPDAEWRVKLEV